MVRSAMVTVYASLRSLYEAAEYLYVVLLTRHIIAMNKSRIQWSGHVKVGAAAAAAVGVVVVVAAVVVVVVVVVV
jgi:hypothetical protein